MTGPPAGPKRSSARVGVAIGVLAGLAGGLLGVGGGFIMVPLQVIWARASQRRASGTSLAAIVPMALVGASVYYFGRDAHQIDFPVAFFLILGSSGGAYVGARVMSKVSERALGILIASLLVLAALRELVGVFVQGPLGLRGSAPGAADPWHFAVITVCGLVIGILSGLTGVGGGIFLVPTMVALGLGQRIAQGTSLVAVLPTAAVGALTHFRRGNVDLRAAAWMGVAGMPAALTGAALALVLPQRLLAVVFGLFLLFAAARLWPRPRLHADEAPSGEPGRSGDWVDGDED